MILYCGDSDAKGPARYLLSLLKHQKVRMIHVPPGKKIPRSAFSPTMKGIILSDYSYYDLDAESEKRIIHALDRGTKLLMVGGWGSFSGPFGHWRKSKIADRLPVICRTGDDRQQFPGGALVTFEQSGGILDSALFKEPPMICGVNNVQVRKGASVLLSARPVEFSGGSVKLSRKKYPLFVLNQNKTAAALTTDLAPHWCGGLVDWGHTLKKLSYRPDIAVQVGIHYIRFVSSLIRWLSF